MYEESIRRFCEKLRAAIDEFEMELLNGDARGSKEMQDKDVLEIIITNYLRKMKLPSYLKGYEFIKEAFIMGVIEPQILKGKITKVLYPRIAEKYGESMPKVERAIRYAIGMIWKEGDKEMLNHICGSDLEKRPTNAKFISALVEYYNMQQMH